MRPLVDIPPSPCLNCNNVVDFNTTFNTQVPQPGDFVVCPVCGYFMRFDKNMNLQDLTEEDREAAIGMSDAEMRAKREEINRVIREAKDRSEEFD